MSTDESKPKPGCFCCHPKPEPDGPKPLNKRRCTDCLCLLLFVAFFSGMGFIFTYAMLTGDWRAYIYASDYAGNRCGQGEFVNRSKAFYPRLATDLIDQAAIIYTAPWELKLYALCVASCPVQFDVSTPTFVTDYNYNPDSQLTQNFGSGTRRMWVSALPTVDVLNRCVPRTESGTAERDLCAFPNCTSTDVDGLGVTCDVPGTGDWEVCANKSSAPDAVARCDTQRKVCAVKSTRWNGVAYSAYTSDTGTGEALAALADRVNGVYSVVGSLAQAWGYIIVGGIVAPVMVAFVFMMLLRFFAKIVVYLLLVLLVLFLFAAVILCYYKSGMDFGGLSAESLLSGATNNISLFEDPVLQKLAEVNEGDKWIWGVAFWVMLIFSTVVLISLMIARKKIKVVVAIIVESSAVFASMPSLMIFPSWSVFVQGAVCVWGIAGAGMLLSMKPESYDAALDLIPDVNQTQLSGLERFRQTQPDALTNIFLILQFFAWLWGMQFVQAAAWTTMSGAVCHWYFFRNDEKEETRIPIMGSLYRVLRFHVGSIAFGSLIIAICQFLRWMLLYLERHFNQSNNPLIKMAFKCCALCLYCLEKSIKFVTYYGFVFVALKGDNFCSASFNTFSFITGNPMQVATNSLVTNLLTMVCVFTIPIGCAITTFAYLEANTDVVNPAYPAIAIFAIAMFVTNACMNVFECVVTTIFVCCFRDKAMYKGRHMSASLRSAFGIDAPPPAEKGGGKGDAPDDGDGDGAYGQPAEAEALNAEPHGLAGEYEVYASPNEGRLQKV